MSSKAVGLLEACQLKAHSELKGGTQNTPFPKTRSSCGSDGVWGLRHSKEVAGRGHSPGLIIGILILILVIIFLVNYQIRAIGAAWSGGM